MRKLSILLILVLCLSFVLIGGVHAENEGFPTKGWETSTPEAQGMDSNLILKALQTIQSTEANIHSMLIIRNGKLVTEYYKAPFNKDMKHTLFSVTKSFTSTLMGIAKSEGYIESLDQKVLSFFPEISPQNPSENKSTMTIKDLLTMRAGHTEETTGKVTQTGDWVKTFLDLPVENKPGTNFVYDTCASHMLSAIVQNKTGKTLSAYAKEKLFSPLGISKYYWVEDPKGINFGGSGLRLTPRDMAKLGYLYLNKGMWDGKQVVPSEWVEEATTNHVPDVGNSSGYGYQFWINSFGGYRADGYAGQFVFVIPKMNLIAVFTNGTIIGYDQSPHPHYLVEKYVIPSVKSDKALPKNDKAVASITKIIKASAGQTPKIPTSLPNFANQISGKTYKFSNNASTGLDFNSFSLTFKQKNECTLKLTQYKKAVTLKVGLDSIFRANKAVNVGLSPYATEYGPVWLKGTWYSDSIFVIEWQYDGELYAHQYTFRFSGSRVNITTDSGDKTSTNRQLSFSAKR